MRRRTHSAVVLVAMTLGAIAYANSSQSPSSSASSASSASSSLRQLAYLKASNPAEDTHFGCGGSLTGHAGNAAAISPDGNTVAIGAPHDNSGASGINGDQADNAANQSGAAYVFTRNGSSWSQQAYVKSSMTRPNVLFGYSIGISGNGDTLAVAEFDADRGKGALYVLARSGGAWSHQARIQPESVENGDSLGYALAISDDGNTIAAGAADEDCTVPGINPAGCDKDAERLTPTEVLNGSFGAAYIFVRNGSTWTEQAFIKASNPAKGDWFGVHLSLSGDGNTLAVCSPSEDSAATGINGKQDDESADIAGAVYVFTRNATVWSQHAYVKASDTVKFGEFGSAVSLARDGRMMAVKGLRTGNSAPGSGAVYIFTR